MDAVSLGSIAIKIMVGFISLSIILISTGRTSLSQLTPFHFVFIMLLDDFFGHIIYENNVSIFKYLYAVGLWTFFMIMIEYVTLKCTKIRFFIHGKPYIVIRNGILDYEVIKKERLDLNQLLSMLRQKSVFSVREVAFAILESNGQISISLKSKYKNPTIEDLNLMESQIVLPRTLVIDGKIIHDNLRECGFDENWLISELNNKGYDVKSIFYAEWKNNEGIHISPK